MLLYFVSTCLCCFPGKCPARSRKYTVAGEKYNLFLMGSHVGIGCQWALQISRQGARSSVRRNVDLILSMTLNYANIFKVEKETLR